MKYFNKKKIKQNSKGKTTVNTPQLTVTTIDNKRNKYNASREYFYMCGEQDENTMTVVTLGADYPIPMVIETSGELEEWYRLIGCSRIDIVTAGIGHRHYDIILDDESLLKDELITSATDKTGKPLLMGNLIVCNFNDKGEETSLDDEDVCNILNHIRDVAGCWTGTGEHRYWTLLSGIEI